MLSRWKSKDKSDKSSTKTPNTKKKRKGRDDDNWKHGNSNDGGLSDGGLPDSNRSRGRQSRRDDPRRHTLTGHGYIPSGHHTMHNFNNLEQSIPRGYSQAHAQMYDDDPGIMSEVETASTGFRRGGKQRSSLPVVRTPSKTLERPLGLVFLQYRNETKRALLPNEITSIDTVKALFVRSFPKQLSMQYMDSPVVKIYIHDSNKDMFYELEDVRAHLRDIRDRSVLRLFESSDFGGSFPGVLGVSGVPVPPASVGTSCSGSASWDQDQSYFSEPEMDSEYNHQHIHKSKVTTSKPPYYIETTGTINSLNRGGMRTYTNAERIKPLVAGPTDGYISSPERSRYEDPYYAQYMARHAGIATIIDEETSDSGIIDEQYSIYGMKPNQVRVMRQGYDSAPRITNHTSEQLNRLRVEQMERQLANLTGLVHKALQAPPATSREREYLQAAAAAVAAYPPPTIIPPSSQEKTVSFEKSVSFCDDPPDMNSPKQHSPQHTGDTKPAKPAIKSSTLPRTASQAERDRLKPAPPPKPVGLGPQMHLIPAGTNVLKPMIQLASSDVYNQLLVLLKNCRDLRVDMKTLKRLTTTHIQSIKQEMTYIFTKLAAIANGVDVTEQDIDILAIEEESYKNDMTILENDLYELEISVEILRGKAANRETRVNMIDVEHIAMILSKSSKTVADWKLKFPVLQESIKRKLTLEMDKIGHREKLLDEEPERLEMALRRCKKLTGTLVTLKRLACVQEQRIPCDGGRVSPGSSCGVSSDELPSDICNSQTKIQNDTSEGRLIQSFEVTSRPENALDILLDELQTFAKPAVGESNLHRLYSYPSGSETAASPPVHPRSQPVTKPPLPERHPELLAMVARRPPPPPPPRTTSRSPLASPTSPPTNSNSKASPANSSSCESVNSQDASLKSNSRHEILELRHKELLKKQRALQEQYNRLQMMQRSNDVMTSRGPPDLKKTGSESNIISKMNLNMATTNNLSGSLTHLNENSSKKSSDVKTITVDTENHKTPIEMNTVSKVYETDIL